MSLAVACPQPNFIVIAMLLSLCAGVALVLRQLKKCVACNIICSLAQARLVCTYLEPAVTAGSRCLPKHAFNGEIAEDPMAKEVHYLQRPDSNSTTTSTRPPVQLLYCTCCKCCMFCAGKLVFLHTNMSPKWNLAIPADFDFYSRRWQVLSPSIATAFSCICIRREL